MCVLLVRPGSRLVQTGLGGDAHDDIGEVGLGDDGALGHEDTSFSYLKAPAALSFVLYRDMSMTFLPFSSR